MISDPQIVLITGAMAAGNWWVLFSSCRAKKVTSQDGVELGSSTAIPYQLVN
jgi:hypothetical protein